MGTSNQTDNKRASYLDMWIQCGSCNILNEEHLIPVNGGITQWHIYNSNLCILNPFIQGFEEVIYAHTTPFLDNYLM